MTGHLIHIGYAKTGTNFLRRWFNAHPQLGYAEGGIAGFRDVYGVVRAGAALMPRPLYWVTSAEGLSTPHVDFGGHDIDYERMSRTPMPRAQEEVCHLLKSLFPDAYVLVVTRGFRSMILSGYSQYVRTGGDGTLADLCVQAGRDGGQIPWDYDSLIGHYRRAFGDDRVIVMPYELLQDDPSRFLDTIAQRLGLSTLDIPAERPNPSLSPVELAWYPLLAQRMRKLPLRGRLRQRAMQHFVQATMTNRLSGAIQTFQRLRPQVPVTAKLVPPDLLEGYRGLADTLRDHPLYAPYHAEYLIDPAEEPAVAAP